MSYAPFILLCIAVIIGFAISAPAAPSPTRWGHWIAVAFAVLALLVVILNLFGAR